MLSDLPGTQETALSSVRPERHDQDLVEALLRISSSLAASLDLGDLLPGVVEGLGLALDVTLFIVGLTDEAAGQLRFVYATCDGAPLNLPAVDVLRDEGLAARLARQCDSVQGRGDAGEGLAPGLAPGVALPYCYFGAPLLNQGRPVGSMVVGNDCGVGYGVADRRLLHLLANQISMVAEKARLYEAVLRHAKSLEERVISRTAELEAEKTRFEGTVQSLSEGLLLFDLKNRLTFANDQAPRLLHLPVEQLIGIRVEELWVQPGLEVSDAVRVEAEFHHALQTLEARPEMKVNLEESERGRFLNLRLFPVHDSHGTFLGGGITLQDVTREYEMDRMKDELVNVVSHELRTPLSSVMGFAELLMTREFTDDKRTEIVETIHKEAERLAGLVDNFLDLRRLEGGGVRIVLREVELTDIVGAAAGSFVLGQRKHTLRLDLPPDLPPVLADPERVAQALRNLLANAIKYAPRGGEVVVAARCVGSEAVVTVTDQGLGLPPEVIPQLFQRFYRVDSTDRREIGGTGLGLAIIRQIVLAHGGRVWAESPGPGLGSTFGFSLPLARAPESVVADGRSTGPEVRYILLVERDPGQVALLREHITAAGYGVVHLPNPKQAIELAQARLPAGVIIDCLALDENDVVRAIEGLRQLEHGGDLPIVVTGELDEGQRWIDRGASGFVEKPFNPNRIITLLEQRARHRVLVVDDQKMITHLLCTILERSGYEVQSASDGEHVVDRVEQEGIDLLVLDLNMPGVSGFEVLEDLRRRSPERAIPVIVATDRDLSEEDRRRLERLQAILLPKGDCTPVRLRAAVNQALRRGSTLSDATSCVAGTT